MKAVVEARKKSSSALLVSRLIGVSRWSPQEIYFLKNSGRAEFPDLTRLQAVLETNGSVPIGKSHLVARHLFQALDLDRDGVVSSADWVMCAEKMARSSVKEHFVFLSKYVCPPTGILRKADSVASLRELFDPILFNAPEYTTSPKYEEELRVLLSNFSAEAIMFTAGRCEVIVRFSRVLALLFIPLLQEMVAKLKKSSRHTLHSVSLLTEGMMPPTVDVLCGAPLKAHSLNCNNWNFELDSMRDQKLMVEAIAYGVSVNPAVDDWVALGVPLLLLALRVHLRSYYEAVFTQYLSLHAIQACANADEPGRLDELQACCKMLPLPHAVTLKRLMSTMVAVSRERKWISTVSVVLGCALFNARTNDYPVPEIVEEMTKLLFVHWDARFAVLCPPVP